MTSEFPVLNYNQGDGVPCFFEHPLNTILFENLTYKGQTLEPSLVDTTPDIPQYLSPYRCGDGFSAQDSSPYFAFCESRVLIVIII
jgi:hypothetical protein